MSEYMQGTRGQVELGYNHKRYRIDGFRYPNVGDYVLTEELTVEKCVKPMLVERFVLIPVRFMTVDIKEGE